jgi:hypothetical protein
MILPLAVACSGAPEPCKATLTIEPTSGCTIEPLAVTWDDGWSHSMRGCSELRSPGRLVLLCNSDSVSLWGKTEYFVDRDGCTLHGQAFALSVASSFICKVD